MARNRRYDYVWHVNETATPFRIELRNADGTPLTSVVSAVFTLINAATDEAIIRDGACQSVTGGVLLYYPSEGELDTACLFRSQFVATLSGGSTLPAPWYEGEIQANL